MANTITAILPKIISRGLLVLRENALMPRLVNNSYSSDAREKGDTINVPLPAALTVTNVTAAATPPTPQDSSPTKVAITLNQHKRIDFHLTDRDIVEIDRDRHFIPMQLSEAFKMLANTVDDYLHQKAEQKWYNFGGTSGTTPFATNLNAFRDARKYLNKDLAPMDNRRVILDPDAEANALVLSQFLKADERGDQGGIISGMIGRKLGADWYLSQNVRTHTAGTWSIAASQNTEVKAAATAGTSTMILQGSSTTTTVGGTLLVGDIFKVTGDSQPYVITANATVAAAAGATLQINVSPVLRATIAAGATVTFDGNSDLGPTNYVNNLCFHRDAIGFASRPLMESSMLAGAAGGNMTQVVSDPVSGLSFRLELIREYKQWMWDLDILYGGEVIRRELGAKILG